MFKIYSVCVLRGFTIFKSVKVAEGGNPEKFDLIFDLDGCKDRQGMARYVLYLTV